MPGRVRSCSRLAYPKPFAPRIKAAGALLICQVQSEDMAQAALEAGADILVAQGTEAGGHGASRTTLDIVPAIVDLAAGRVPVVAAGGIGDWTRACGDDRARRRRCSAGYALLCQSGSGRSGGGQATNLRRDERQHHAGIIFDMSRNNVWPAPFTGRCLINDHARRWTGQRTRTAAKCGRGRRRICGGQGRRQFRCCSRDCWRSRWADP